MSQLKSFPIQRTLPMDKYQGMSAQQIKSQQEGRLRKAAQMYEEQFLNTLVGQMRKTVPESDLIKKSYAEKIYENKLDNNYVNSWVNRGGVGLSDLIYEQMHQRIFPDQNLAPPSGPLPTAKKIMMPVSTKEVDEPRPSYDIKETPPPQGEQGVNLIFEKSGNKPSIGGDVKSQSGGEMTSPQVVTSPWDGVVTAVLKGDQLQQVKIMHSNGIQSQISYVGDSEALVQGQALDSGAKLGEMSEQASGLHWQLRLKS